MVFYLGGVCVGVRFVHLKKYKYLYTQFHWFKLASSLVGQKFNSEIIWGSSFRVLGSVWYVRNWNFPCAGPHPYSGKINLVHMPQHWPGFSTPENVLSCLEKINRVVELDQARSETRSSLSNSKAISNHCPGMQSEMSESKWNLAMFTATQKSFPQMSDNAGCKELFWLLHFSSTKKMNFLALFHVTEGQAHLHLHPWVKALQGRGRPLKPQSQSRVCQ